MNCFSPQVDVLGLILFFIFVTFCGIMIWLWVGKNEYLTVCLGEGYMSSGFRANIPVFWCPAVIICLLCLGCSREYYKADADNEVYRIIDNKWKDDFGVKANYKIADAASSPNDIELQKSQNITGVISLAQAVAIATANNRGYQTQKEQLYLSALGLTLERHKYARQWFATVDGGFVKDGDDEDVSFDSSAGVDHTLLLADGVLFGTSIAVDWARFLTGDSRTTLGTVLTATLEVPLLGTGAGKVARENLTQNERNVLYQIRSFNRFRQNFVVSIISDYYRVLRQRDTVTNAENNYEMVADSKQRLQAEADAGIRPPFEVDQAEQNLLGARDNFVRAQQAYQQILDEFKITLALPTDADIELDQNELKALEAIGITEPNFTAADAIETALVSRLDLANSADFVDDTARKVMLAADGLGTQVELSAGLEVASKEKTDFTRLQFHEGLYNLGIDSDLPLDRKAERNAWRSALITLSRQQRQYEQDIEDVKLAVRQAFRRLNEAAERYRIQKISLKLAARRVESTTLFLQAGQAQTRDLLEAQDALLLAENNLTAALVDHTIAKLSFYRDIGLLMVRPDGMWNYEN